jgi:hypothetical protein
MELLRWKTRISILWIIEAVGMSVYMFLLFTSPGEIANVMVGSIIGLPITGAVRLYLAIFWWVPFIMAFLSVTLKDSANRRTNLIVGILFAVACALGLIRNAVEGMPASILVNYFIGVVFAALIAWYAWKWPRQAA